MPKVEIRLYEIVLKDLKEGIEYTYSYNSLKEAEMYYIEYKKAFKNYRITLRAVLLDEII